MGKFVLLYGMHNAQSYRAALLKEGCDPANTVFIFPGNEEHHGVEISPESVKGGGGLASLAEKIGMNGGLTLSMPNTFYLAGHKLICDESLEAKLSAGVIAATYVDACSVLDIWAAIGGGNNICLPIRTHRGDVLFSKALSGTDNMEPSFGGAINTRPMLKLQDFYLQNLNVMKLFLELDPVMQTPEKLNQILIDEGVHEGLHSAIIDVFSYTKDNGMEAWFRKRIIPQETQVRAKEEWIT